MDRRTFLTGILGLTGAVAVATIAGPAEAIAGVPDTRGILDELEASPIDAADNGGDAKVELVDHRRDHRWDHRWGDWRDRRDRHHRRRHRRREWRRVCRRYWHHGRWRRRCYRERVWVWHYR